MKDLLTIEAVEYRYPDGTPALQGVCASVGEGERVGLVGPNGSGKTTLALVLAGLLRPGRGAIRWQGETVGRNGWAALRAQVGFALTNPDDQLILPTVLDDVCFGPLAAGTMPDQARGAARRWLDALGIGDTAGRFPGHLSAGQKRLAALAGVLVMEPRLLVLDEPTAFLDPRARRDVIARLRALPQAMLLITHDLDLVLDLCHRAVLLDGGRVAAAGPAGALLTDEPLLRAHGLERPLSLGPAPKPAGAPAPGRA